MDPALPAPREPQRKRGRARVAALMKAAAELFVEKGFEATTMTEIAARAGGSIGSLYLFFPTKEALAHATLTALADELGARLDALEEEAAQLSPAGIAERLFAQLATFLGEHPEYGALLDLPGEAGWRRTVRLRRRTQIMGLFARARPPLPPEKAERMAVIIPQLMRIGSIVDAEAGLREGVFEEVRLMLHRHLEAMADDADA
ncbi:TetR/AcrR family transcriptional regulator [Terrihabitans sp. B22-R8]|uniref:TetR/AcrR family transcriptional regulator n=1 Tax=Terrihabitans sp. B22-R8 TaxID=3425128 RepID=UPI00403C5983